MPYCLSYPPMSSMTSFLNNEQEVNELAIAIFKTNALEVHKSVFSFFDSLKFFIIEYMYIIHILFMELYCYIVLNFLK